MVDFVDVRIVKRTYKGGMIRYFTQVNYPNNDGGDNWLDTGASLKYPDGYTSLDDAEKQKQVMLNQILESEEVVE